MTPYTWADAEADLETALAMHDADEAERVARWMDRTGPPVRDPNVLGAALWFAQLGLPVFPLVANTKTPFPGSRGVTDASTDPELVRAMFTRPANLGLATGHGVDALDFDGLAGHRAWGERFPGGWEDAGVTVLATVATPRPGGFHVYVVSNGLKNARNLVPHVDYRGLGGYVVAPPSVCDDREGQHAGTYRFLRVLGLGR